MTKKFFAFFTTVIMLVCMGIPASASNCERSVLSEDELIEQLNAIDFGRNITFTKLSESYVSENELLAFDSVDDFEIYLRNLLNNSIDNNVAKNARINLVSNRSAGWCDGTVWWWGGGNTSLLSLTNAVIRFYYDGVGTMSNISVTNSYMTGIVGATWTHISGSATPLGGMDAKYSVTGLWFIGVELAGFPVGASFTETLNSPKITVTME